MNTSTYIPNIVSAGAIFSVSIAFVIVCLVANWRVYDKAGRPGWASLIPFYNTYVYYDIIYGNGMRMFLLLIPFFNIYISIRSYFDMARAYGQSAAFGFGLWLLNPVFICIAGFSSEIEYDGNVRQLDDDEDEDEMTEDELAELRRAALEKLRKKKAERENNSFEVY